MREQTGHYSIDHLPQLARQWNKCVKHCLQYTYPSLDSGLTYTRRLCVERYPTKVGHELM